jgi:uncharacterized protein involved in cysteine biosynthesis
MRRVIRPALFLPVVRALSQLDDPVFRGVLWCSVGWSAGCLAGLYMLGVWFIHRVWQLHGWLAWGADALSSIAASLLALWLFLPVATVIGTMYLDRIAAAVEHRFYPWLPPPTDRASFVEQTWDGAVVAIKVLALNVVALILAFMLPGAGLVLGWLIAGYAIGRGLFVAVAMRRMPRMFAESLYRGSRVAILGQGAILALAAYVPILNLFIPVIGVAAMVHILDFSLATAGSRQP